MVFKKIFKRSASWSVWLGGPFAGAFGKNWGLVTEILRIGGDFG
jgi:hypothetical protein